MLIHLSEASESQEILLPPFTASVWTSDYPGCTWTSLPWIVRMEFVTDKPLDLSESPESIESGDESPSHCVNTVPIFAIVELVQSSTHSYYSNTKHLAVQREHPATDMQDSPIEAFKVASFKWIWTRHDPLDKIDVDRSDINNVFIQSSSTLYYTLDITVEFSLRVKKSSISNSSWIYFK
ncbi:MAG: hypothetical protein Sylvanvirus4_36 [Sylvanvirus sp.]|uniref:Uncharacterized protein n=1 Tax=Sylvanvirus sp. TaxID=2487774 RepID=A0A3G5AHD3_9VIRU|nr:MAG: hypothetical protein Sylvanvirus4_36 [Sylvanvirus sp.]